MRILLVGANHRKKVRAATIQIHGLARELHTRGHAVTLLQAAKKEDEAPVEGVTNIYVHNTTKSTYPLLFALRRLAPFDLVHANDQSGAFFALRHTLRKFPLVVEFHPPSIRYEPFWKTNWRWRYLEIAARLAPSLVTNSNWLAGALAERYGLPKDKFTSIPTAAGNHWFTAATQKEKDAAIRIALINMKGVDIALRAFAKLGTSHAAVLDLYGVHREESKFRQLAAELGVADRVYFHGFVQNEKLPHRLNSADLVINPTQRDNYPQVLLEIAALGLPTVTGKVGGVSEIVVDGETGILCDPEDVDAFAQGLEMLVSNGDLRRSMGEQARKRADTLWRWPAVVDRYEKEVFLPLISGGLS